MIKIRKYFEAEKGIKEGKIEERKFLVILKIAYKMAFDILYSKI